MISVAIARVFDSIFLLLFVTILLTWVPNINWNKQPFFALRAFSNLFFAPFRKIIPPIGMFDFSPIAAFICLSFLSRFLVDFLIGLGL